MKNLIRLTLTLIATLIVTNGGSAQTPEWTEYCRLRDEINHNDSLSQEAIFRMYCRMDSIYNGNPAYSDLSGFLKIAVACNEQEKMKELAFRIVRWKCWDSRLFNQPELAAVKQTYCCIEQFKKLYIFATDNKIGNGKRLFYRRQVGRMHYTGRVGTRFDKYHS